MSTPLSLEMQHAREGFTGVIIMYSVRWKHENVGFAIRLFKRAAIERANRCFHSAGDREEDGRENTDHDLGMQAMDKLITQLNDMMKRKQNSIFLGYAWVPLGENRGCAKAIAGKVWLTLVLACLGEILVPSCARFGKKGAQIHNAGSEAVETGPGDPKEAAKAVQAKQLGSWVPAFYVSLFRSLRRGRH